MFDRFSMSVYLIAYICSSFFHTLFIYFCISFLCSPQNGIEWFNFHACVSRANENKNWWKEVKKTYIMNVRAVAEIEREKKVVVCKMRLAINISSIKPKSNKNLFQLNDMKCSCVHSTPFGFLFWNWIVHHWMIVKIDGARAESNRTPKWNRLVLCVSECR